MSTLNIEICTDNAAFGDEDDEDRESVERHELASIFRRLAQSLTERASMPSALLDTNGNRVGTIWVEDD